jgi:hypothetical protein
LDLKEPSVARRPKIPEWDPPVAFSVGEDGIIHTGHYELERSYSRPETRMIRVTGPGGSKTTHLGSSPAESLARLILMSELIPKDSTT